MLLTTKGADNPYNSRKDLEAMKKFYVDDNGNVVSMADAYHGYANSIDPNFLGTKYLNEGDILDLLIACKGDSHKLPPELQKGIVIAAACAKEKRKEKAERAREQRRTEAEKFHKQVMFEIHEVVGDKPFTVKSLQFEAARRNCFTVRSSAMYSNHLRKALYERDASLRVLKDPVRYSFKDGTTATRFAFNGPAVYKFVG